MGWLGTYGQLKYALSIYGVDSNENGDPMTAVEDEQGVHEPGPAHGLCFFLGIKSDNADVVVGDNVRAFVNGKPAGTVAAYMNGTSYGVRGIKVF